MEKLIECEPAVITEVGDGYIVEWFVDPSCDAVALRISRLLLEKVIGKTIKFCALAPQCSDKFCRLIQKTGNFHYNK